MSGGSRETHSDTWCVLHHAGPFKCCIRVRNCCAAVQTLTLVEDRRAKPRLRRGEGIVGLEFRAYTLETPCKNTETIRALKHITSLNWRIPLPVGSGVFIY